MKRFVCLLFLLSSTTALHASSSIERSMNDLFEGISSPGGAYKASARKILEKVNDEPLIKLAIQTSKLVFPEVGSFRADTLKYLLIKKSIKSLAELQNVFSLLKKMEDSYSHLAYFPRFEKAKDLLNKFTILSLLDQIDDNVKVEPDAPYTKYALQVVNSLENGLRIRQMSEKCVPCLEFNDEEKPLSLFVGLANSFSESGKNLKSTDALSVWGLLAKSYLKVALEALTTSEQFREALDYFAPELKSRIQEKKTTYDWFTLFTDRLSILMTKPKERNIDPLFNTKFGTYKVALTTSQFKKQPGWYSHEGYENACQTVGGKYTQNVFSYLALGRELFPDIVMLPYPFELSDGDLLKIMPSPEGSHLWALGFALDSIWADGALLTPSMFREHDKGHLVEVIRGLSSAAHFYVKNEDYYVPTVEEIWSYNRQGRKLYYAALKKMQEMVLENKKNDEQARMNTFLGFYVFHEQASCLEYRLDSLICDTSPVVSNASFKELKNPNYYLNLLPNSLKKMKDHDDNFRDKLTIYIEQFQKDFAEQDRDNNLATSIKEWLEHPKAYHASPQNTQDKEGFIYFMNAISYAYEIKNKQSNVDNYVKLPNDASSKYFLECLTKHKTGSTFQRCYFLGSPFYQGEKPPRFEIEELGH